MNTCYIEVCGGLGNQLFQIATGYAYSKKYNKELYVDTAGWSASQGLHPDSYKNTIFTNFQYRTAPYKQYMPLMKLDEIVEQHNLKFQKLPNTESSVRLRGYFQSPKYFQEHLEDFEKELVLPEVKTDHITSDSIAFHIRKGDYKNWVHIFGDNTNYFRRMFEKFKGEDIHVYTDAPYTILELFAEYGFKLIQTSSELNDLTMLTKYDRIVCSNSSFSWWGAVLGSPKKEVIVPDKWLLNVEDCSDIYMPNMIKYEF